jgi:hypothetical protein
MPLLIVDQPMPGRTSAFASLLALGAPIPYDEARGAVALVTCIVRVSSPSPTFKPAGRLGEAGRGWGGGWERLGEAERGMQSAQPGAINDAALPHIEDMIVEDRGAVKARLAVDRRRSKKWHSTLSQRRFVPPRLL